MKDRPCIFLDRDGVINKERGEYTFLRKDFSILDGVAEALMLAHEAGFLLIVITNQGGVDKGLYSKEDVMACHDYLQIQTGGLFDDIYLCPHHPSKTESLMRKPDSLMFEKAIAKWAINTEQSYMIGDADRDLMAAQKVGVKGLLVKSVKESVLVPKEKQHQSLLDAVRFILRTK
jgi:D-glycero-D-manno-heptose 1,7-bisphosphate phosphatase